ncbi:MAG: DNA polymerase Y family protein [Ilumatobacteraceae bacterium]
MAPAHSAISRLAVVHCPQWSVVAAGCAPDEAVAVVHANRVVARSVAAAASGVRTGHRRREAQARCPSLRIVADEPQLDARTFGRVAEAVAAMVPRLEISRPGVLTFATRGPSRYFGGDLAMAERVGALVTEAVLELTGPIDRIAGACGVGIADGRFAAGVAARHAARHGRPEVIEPSGSRAFLAPLALRWLHEVGELDPDQVHLLGRLGLRTLGDLAALPEPDVLARFGWQGAMARRMAAGLDDRPHGSEDPPSGLVVDHHFDEPVQHLDAVVFAARQLVDDVVGRLSSTGRVCTQFAVTAETEYGERCERVWTLSTGFSATAMLERLRWQLDGWASAAETVESADADAANVARSGVVHLRIEPTQVRADDGVQLGLWGGRTQADEWARRAATRLAGLVGDDRVVVPEWRGGRQPGDLHCFVPASLSSIFEGGDRALPAAGTAAERRPWPGRLPAPWPAVVHPDPHPVEVLDAEGADVAVTGRGAVSASPAVLRDRAGPAVPVVGWAGPWLLDERWWDAARHRRVARFQLLLADGRALLAMVERRQWWLVAEYA